MSGPIDNLTFDPGTLVTFLTQVFNPGTLAWYLWYSTDQTDQFPVSSKELRKVSWWLYNWYRYLGDCLLRTYCNYSFNLQGPGEILRVDLEFFLTIYLGSV